MPASDASSSASVLSHSQSARTIWVARPDSSSRTTEQVREKFLNMIGIESRLPHVEPSTGSTAEEASSSEAVVQHGDVGSCQGWVHPRTRSVTCFTESLKYDVRADQDFSSKRRKKSEVDDRQPLSSVRSSGKPKRILYFSETVKVVPIPMRTEYSNRVRSRMWSNALEIYQNATRNTIEFASEGYELMCVLVSTLKFVVVAIGSPCQCCC
jgi:hypothetical protein